MGATEPDLKSQHASMVGANPSVSIAMCVSDDLSAIMLARLANQSVLKTTNIEVVLKCEAAFSDSF